MEIHPPPPGPMSSEYAENRAQDSVIRRDSMQAPYATPAPLEGLPGNTFQRSGAQGDDNSAYTAPLQPPSFTRQNPVQPQGANLIALSGDRPRDLAADSILTLASTAVLCQEGKSSPVSMGIPVGALLTPLPEGAPAPALLPRRPTSCESCRAFVNLYCKVNHRNGEWDCIFCGLRNEASGALATQAIDSCEELRLEAVDYLEADTRAGERVPERQAPTVLAIDVTSDAADLELLKTALIQAVRELPPNRTLVLLTFSGSVSVYRLRESPSEDYSSESASSGAPTLVTADCYPGHSVPSDAVLKGLFSRVGQYAVPLHSCRATAEAIIMSLRPQHQALSARERPRALGAAMEIALYLARGNAALGKAASPVNSMAAKGQVLVVCTGPTTKGPGFVPLNAIDGDSDPDDAYSEEEARKYFGWLADVGKVSGVTVDMLAVGLSAVNIPLVGPLAAKSGGVLNIQEGFGQLFGAYLSAVLQRRVGSNGGMDLKVGKGARLVQVIGPAVQLKNDDGKPSGDIYQLNGVERGQGLALLLELRREIPDDYIHIQVVVGWVTPDGAILERCVTRRMRVTKVKDVYLDSIDPEAAALLLAKKVVHEAQRSGAARDRGRSERIRTAIGRHLYHTANRMGSFREVAGSGWFAPARRDWLLPPQLTPVAQALYQLQRGSMLGELVGHADERALLQSTFLAAAQKLAYRMLLPKLYVFDAGTGSFDAAPAVDLALSTDVALVLDHGTHVFIWLGVSGSSSSSSSSWSKAVVEAAAQGFVAGLAEGRFPLPEVRVVQEGTGDARYISSRLKPIHLDTPAEQLAQYPPLAKLSEAGRAALFSKLPPTTEPSFLQWCRNFKVEASVGKGSDDELSRSAGRDSDRLAAVTAAMLGAAI